MSTQSEAALEDNLMKTLIDGGYHLISIKDENDLEANFKQQLELFNKTTIQLS